jgi:type VI protein secretion system component VasK
MAQTVKWGNVRVSRGLDLGVALAITGVFVVWALAARRKVQQVEQSEAEQQPPEPEPREPGVPM